MVWEQTVATAKKKEPLFYVNTESKRVAKVKTTFEALERGYLTALFCFATGAPGISKKGIFFSVTLLRISHFFTGSRIARPGAFAV
jgi:hypothetical protein